MIARSDECVARRVHAGLAVNSTVALFPILVGFLLVTIVTARPAAARERPDGPSAPETPRVSAVRTGTVPTHDGLRLVLTADEGTIRILTDANGEVRYRVVVQAEASDPAANQRLKQFALAERAASGGVLLTGQMPGPRDADRVWVTYEVHVPHRYNLQISTQAGDVSTQDIDGQVVISTGGGNIQAGKIGDSRDQLPAAESHRELMARLDTAGGHIVVGDVAGSLRASTAGGHITAGNIDGDAILQTGGGHIHVGRVTGVAQLSTGGGDIMAERADNGATAATGGGRIEFAEAAGTIEAHTAGGGVRIDRVAGPTELESNDGGILLAGVQAPLHASTGTGTITASFSPQYAQTSSLLPTGQAVTELASNQGDIIVYLPRKIALTIDAVVEHGADGRIIAAPSVPLRISTQNFPTGRALHGQCELNGGGKVLHLRTESGNIELRFLDPSVERRMALEQVPQSGAEQGNSAVVEANQKAAVTASAGSGAPDNSDVESNSAFEELRRRFEIFWSSAISVSPDEQQKRLIHSVAPEYPEIARQAGVEGDVTLRVVISKDGSVEDVAPISGEPVLARAAAEAVERWRYSPELLGGRPIGVITTVTVAFRLR